MGGEAFRSCLLLGLWKQGLNHPLLRGWPQAAAPACPEGKAWCCTTSCGPTFSLFPLPKFVLPKHHTPGGGCAHAGGSPGSRWL